MRHLVLVLALLPTTARAEPSGVVHSLDARDRVIELRTTSLSFDTVELEDGCLDPSTTVRVTSAGVTRAWHPAGVSAFCKRVPVTLHGAVSEYFYVDQMFPNHDIPYGPAMVSVSRGDTLVVAPTELMLGDFRCPTAVSEMREEQAPEDDHELHIMIGIAVMGILGIGWLVLWHRRNPPTDEV